MQLEDLGYDEALEQFRQEENLDSFDVGRVISEHKERYVVKTSEGEYDCEIIGNLRYSAQSRSDFPTVGDWVAISAYDDDKALIHSIFPRKNSIERQAVGKQGQKQIIASNIDKALIIQSVDRDFSINRLERYLSICNSSGVEPIIIINKIDLITETELSEIVEKIKDRIHQIDIYTLSNESKKGIDELKETLEKGKTYCMLGSSGVGKSSLLNNLFDKELMKTKSISESANRGRHATTHRELFVLESGGILIDNPGMREVGITDSPDGLEKTFAYIIDLAKECKFNDCTHEIEEGCAVLDGLENGTIDEDSYKNFMKIEREKQHFESTVVERRKKDKEFGKMVKNILKDKKRFKY